MMQIQYKRSGVWYWGCSSLTREFRTLVRHAVCPIRVYESNRIILEFF